MISFHGNTYSPQSIALLKTIFTGTSIHIAPTHRLPTLSDTLAAMASLPRCSLTLAAATPAPRALIYLQRALSFGQNSRSIPSPPILDFLLPSSIAMYFRRSHNTKAPSSAAARETGSATYSRVCQRTRQHKPLVKAWCSSPLSARQSTSLQTRALPARQQPRYFSTTARRSVTRTLFNPQVDEDGNEMRLEITARAAKVRILHRQSNKKMCR